MQNNWTNAKYTLYSVILNEGISGSIQITKIYKRGLEGGGGGAVHPRLKPKIKYNFPKKKYKKISIRIL